MEFLLDVSDDDEEVPFEIEDNVEQFEENELYLYDDEEYESYTQDIDLDFTEEDMFQWNFEIEEEDVMWDQEYEYRKYEEISYS